MSLFNFISIFATLPACLSILLLLFLLSVLGDGLSDDQLRHVYLILHQIANYFLHVGSNPFCVVLAE